ncbi:MAG: hypothetical protein QMB63_08640 [Clostridiaceae bacterium]
MNRKGENAFNLDDERSKYAIGMDIFIKNKNGKIIFLNNHYITVQYSDGIKESFIWHELFEKHNPELSFEEEELDDEDIDID